MWNRHMLLTVPAGSDYWTRTNASLLSELDSSDSGLTSADAAAALDRVGPNQLGTTRGSSTVRLLARQFTSPIVLILVGATILSGVLGDYTDAIIILAIIVLSGLLGFLQERGASESMKALLAVVAVKANVLRDGTEVEIPFAEVVPGDVVRLATGDLVPADCVLLECRGLAVDQSALTGESFPVEKEVGIAPATQALSARSNTIFMGTHISTGTATALVIRTGSRTEIGSVSARLSAPAPHTGFERGLTSFGLLLTRIMAVLVIAIFVVNLVLHRPIVESALFSLALAVGLTPQLLPAIVSISLSRGARRMARAHVIVRRLDAIEDFGSMTVLCSDKTGTMTDGSVTLAGALGIDGAADASVRRPALINASMQTGLRNPMDVAITASIVEDIGSVTKLAELPYDFDRRLLSILALDPKNGPDPVLITKGAFRSVLEACSTVRQADGTVTPIEQSAPLLTALVGALGGEGYRVLGIATKSLADRTDLSLTDERDLTFIGLLSFADPVKPEAFATLEQLRQSGISVRMLTGDNLPVAVHVAAAVGLRTEGALSGSDVDALDDDALARVARTTDVFAELNPLQKERLVHALRAGGAVVGYLGDGINDAPSLRAADVGISVESAADVAKSAASIVMLDKDLAVLLLGVREGRRTFANTMKYVFMTTSANFGNMLSMAAAAIFLPFLPLLAAQILLVNLLTDLPATTIATDTVDQHQVRHPQAWNIRLIRNYMIVFGTISSVFDLATFGILRIVFHAEAAEFRSAWFLASVLTEIMVLFVLRTRGPFYRSRPSLLLIASSVAIAAVTLVLPFTPLSEPLQLVPLPTELFALVLLVVLGYVGVTELAKRVFWRVRVDNPRV